MNTVSIAKGSANSWSLNIQPDRTVLTSCLGIIWASLMMIGSYYAVLNHQLHPAFLLTPLICVPRIFRSLWSLYGRECIDFNTDTVQFTKTISRVRLGKTKQLRSSTLKAVKAITRLRNGGKLDRREYSLEFVGAEGKVQLYSGFTKPESRDLLETLPISDEIKDASILES